MQEEEYQLKINSASDTSEEKSVTYEGAYPKVKRTLLKNQSKSNDSGTCIQNGSAPQSSKGSTYQNSAGCSTWLSSSTTSLSSSLNDISSFDTNNVNDVDNSLTKNSHMHNKNGDALNNFRKKSETNDENDNSSDNEADEVLSDDCCIYTYKGDQFADLPNSFFPLHMLEREDQQCRENHNGCYPRRRNQPLDDNRSNPGSSPEMDYLEMDFDPGPSLEQDSEDIGGVLEETINGSPVPDLPSEQLRNSQEDLNEVGAECSGSSQEPEPGPSYLCSTKSNNHVNCCNSNCGNLNDNIRTKKHLAVHQKGHSLLAETSGNCDFDNVQRNVLKSDNVITHNKPLLGDKRLDRKNLSVDLKKAEADGDKNKNDSDLKSPFDGVMLWTEQEAISNQVTMLPSEVSCGATAVINVMLVLKMRFSIENVKEGICTRLRNDSISIPQYLVSRSFAGVAHENLVRGIHHASHGTLYAKFFQMYPKRDIVLSRWLSHWMKLGAVPIATMNVQRDSSTESSTSDTRHHQMVFGVSSKGIYLTNPLECLQDEELWSRLTSPSVLNIRRQEIVSRWSPDTNLKPLMFQSDDRWKTMNVLGQVVNIIRESPDPSSQEKCLTQYISIPASSGITLVIPRNSPGYEELVSTPDLPLCSTSQ